MIHRVDSLCQLCLLLESTIYLIFSLDVLGLKFGSDAFYIFGASQHRDTVDTVQHRGKSLHPCLPILTFGKQQFKDLTIGSPILQHSIVTIE